MLYPMGPRLGPPPATAPIARHCDSLKTELEMDAFLVATHYADVFSPNSVLR